MSAAVENYRDEMSVSYAVDFNRDREPTQTQKRSRFPDYRRKGSAPARVSGIHCRRSKKWTWGSGRGARTLNARAFASSVAFALVSLAATAFGVTIDYTPVNNAGNTANVSTGWGAVSSVFKISKHETTNEQYKDFLNKVDAAGTNPNGVYNAQMGSDSLGGITFTSAASSGTKYTVKSGTSPNNVAYTNMPVLFTSWFSAARFTNWLQNGQQTNSSSMETGAYTLNNQTSGNIVSRNSGATNFLPSRDEWYKAGFYDGNTVAYKTWSTDSNAQGLSQGQPRSRPRPSVRVPRAHPVDGERYGHAVSRGLEGRDERPARGHGQPRAAAMDRHRLKTRCYGGSPERDQTRVEPSCICRAEQDWQDAVPIHA